MSFKRHRLKAMMKVSPERRRVAKCYFTARDALTSIATDEGWEGCGRPLKIYPLPVTARWARTTSRAASGAGARRTVEAVKDDVERAS